MAEKTIILKLTNVQGVTLNPDDAVVQITLNNETDSDDNDVPPSEPE